MERVKRPLQNHSDYHDNGHVSPPDGRGSGMF